MQFRWMAVSSVGGLLLLIGPAGDLAWAQAPPPLDYFSMSPCRLLDTRQPGQGPALASGAPRPVTATGGSCGIPATARAIAVNITSVAPTGAGNLKLYPGGGTVPPTSALNFAAGQTRANNGVFPLAGNGTLAILATVIGSGTVQVVLDVTGYFASPAPCNGLVYLIDIASRLLSFDPRNLGTAQDPFTIIGPLNCPASPIPVPGLSTVVPYSLAIDRSGSARILYTSGEIFAVDVADASCVATTFQPRQGNEWLVFQQAFATDTSGGTAEKQYVGGGSADGAPGGLFGRLNPSTLLIQNLGQLPNVGDFSPSLTGLGDGTLFGFYPGASTAFVQEIAKSTGAAIGATFDIPGGLGLGASSWAFAHWGGKFYLFITTTDALGMSNSTLRQIDRSTGQYGVVLQNLPYDFIAAGVATCAPLGVN